MSNPSDLYGRPWSESEYIVVLYSYLKNKGKPRHLFSEYVLELAHLLGRTPGAIVMRMENYASIDLQENGRKGLVNLSVLGRSVFQEWVLKPESLNDCAELLLRDARRSPMPDLFEPDPVRIPKAFGKYELLDCLGEGGFGQVYSCINSEDQKPYAMKIIRTDQVEDPEMLSRFRREIKALKLMSCHNVIRIHEDNLDEERAFPAFIMDLGECTLKGFLEKTLASVDRLNGRPLLEVSESVEILQSVIKAVGALHQNHTAIIHRDIKPDNILRLSDQRWVLADFSLAKFVSSAVVTTTFATVSHRGWGTDGYSAPEQWQDFKRTDERADIYSLGVLIWELFSPSWPPLDRSHLQLPPQLEKVVRRATERERESRYASIVDFNSDLLAALRECRMLEGSLAS